MGTLPDMCGRIVDYQTDKEIADLHRVLGKKRLGGEHRPNYNLKPTQTLRAVRLDEAGEREIAAVRWGFVPSWSKEMPKQAWINAKAETMAQTRSMWKAALKARRCLVPVNGFYEWLKPERGPKQPYFIFLPDGPMTFAGIWESWHPDGDDPVESVAVATVEPSKEFSRFHDRQVVVLHTRKEQDAWLSPDTEADDALKLLHPLRSGLLHFRPVGPAVSQPGNHGPECIEEASPGKLPPKLAVKRPNRGRETEQGNLL